MAQSYSLPLLSGSQPISRLTVDARWPDFQVPPSDIRLRNLDVKLSEDGGKAQLRKHIDPLSEN